MNLTGRFAYFFQTIFNWFVECFTNVANIINNNWFLKEILKFVGYFAIGMLAYLTIKWLFNRFLDT